MDNVRVESGPITRITIDRPKALNALNEQTLRELARALDDLDRSARVVVISGGGEKAFVAGADIQAMVDMVPSDAAAFSKLGHSVFDRLTVLDQITIAEVRGFALGGGCELMLACDFAIAGESAQLGQPEVGLGVTPGFGGTTRLVRRIGLSRALQLLTSGERIPAEKALAWGLVNEVVSDDELTARVDTLAGRIVKNAPVAVRYAKRAARHAAETDLNAANAYEQQTFGMCFATEDQSVGMKAFLAKERPKWTGR